MGVILNAKMKGEGKITYEVSLDYVESLQLQGHMDLVHVFSENAAHVESKIAGRGKNEATKYFLIPRQLRKGLPTHPSTKVKCQKLDTKTSTIFIYVVDKLGL